MHAQEHISKISVLFGLIMRFDLKPFGHSGTAEIFSQGLSKLLNHNCVSRADNPMDWPGSAKHKAKVVFVCFRLFYLFPEQTKNLRNLH